MKWAKTNIITTDGLIKEAQTPIIISASRSTDIPAFYTEWLMERLRKNYVKWKNPFNNKDIYVSFQNTRLIVFWSKNPKPIIKYLDEIKEFIPNFYFLFTLNDYESEHLETNVPALNERIDTFIKLSEKIGPEKVIWRYDPLILSNKISINNLLEKINFIGDKLYGYTQKLIFSFLISSYKKVQDNLKKNNIQWIDFSEEKKYDFAKGLNTLNKKWNLKLASCAENTDLSEFNISHNKCIDDVLIAKLFNQDKQLMNFLGVDTSQNNLFNISAANNKLKDKGQRKYCDCIASKDIGQYNTCPHKCIYCYANASSTLAENNYQNHLSNKFGEMIIPL